MAAASSVVVAVAVAAAEAATEAAAPLTVRADASIWRLDPVGVAVSSEQKRTRCWTRGY